MLLLLVSSGHARGRDFGCANTPRPPGFVLSFYRHPQSLSGCANTFDQEVQLRVPVPGPGDHWVELRDAESLVAADEDAWMRTINDAWAQRASAEAEQDDDAEGEPKPKAKLRLTADMLTRRRDDLLASLITDWSYAEPDAVPHIPLPYSTESRKLLPRAAGKALAEAIKPHQDALNAPSGPKEQSPPTSTTDGSGSDSG
jgi:hypothetical protein